MTFQGEVIALDFGTETKESCDKKKTYELADGNITFASGKGSICEDTTVNFPFGTGSEEHEVSD